MADTSSSSLPGLDMDKLEIPEADKTTRKLLMIIEGVYGMGVKKSTEKYGYTEQRYYQLLKGFRKGGVEALGDKKRGPKGNSKRTGEIVQQIIRYKFLDPKSSAEVIAQKLRQRGHQISTSSVQRNSGNTAFKKKLYELNPGKPKEIELQQTKRNVKTASVTPGSNERHVREILGNKLSGTHLGVWLLIPEYLRIGAWDLIRGVFNKSGTNDLDSRMAMQLVGESAICVNRVRAKDSLCNQGFSIANGLSMLVRDESIHDMLKDISVKDAESIQVPLLQSRKVQGHYDDGNIFALDPHRIASSTKRHMPAKKKRPREGAGKMLQNFFCVDAITGQPLAFTIGSSGRSSTKATLDLLGLIESASIRQGLFLADKEHFTRELLAYFNSHEGFDVLMPAPSNKRMEDAMVKLAYQEKWAGYSIAEGVFQFAGDSQKYRIIAQREGVDKSQYSYSAFLTTSAKDATGLITSTFPKRWTIEEFFNFNGDMGWNRASTLNLNIRYARQSMALIAQAATHGLKGRLPGEYESWTADHLASQVPTNMEGDIRVKGDKIIITYYRDHEALNLKSKYSNISERLVSEGVDPRIPWLYDYKLDFQFK